MVIKDKEIIKKTGVKIVLSLLVLLFLGGIWQGYMMNKEVTMFSPPGQLYKINSHNIHGYAIGEGKDTIVFTTGSGTPCAFTDYYYLQSELQNYARTISYDHAGYGFSESTSISRNVDIVVEELHELLRQAGKVSPYILVGHSLSSLEVIHFAQKYPEEVKAIVLLDGGSPEFYAKDSELKPYIINRGMAGLRVSGIVRLLGNIGIELPFLGEDLRYDMLPKEIRSIDKAMYYNYIGNKNNLTSIKNINENAQLVLNNGYLKDIPLIILSSDSGENWEKSQQQLLNWSNNSYQETIPNSKHYIHWSNKEIVVQKILEIVSKE